MKSQFSSLAIHFYGAFTYLDEKKKNSFESNEQDRKVEESREKNLNKNAEAYQLFSTFNKCMKESKIRSRKR